MIVNVPSEKNLNELALRLYFVAWSDLIFMELEFDQVFIPGDNDWSIERAEYLSYCQPELQSLCVIIQQVNELALKARICGVSPYLLLLNSDAKLTNSPKNIDFTTLRTLDAVDLPAAVNSICAKKLSDKYVQSYNQVRAYRNQIAHLGATAKQFLPKELLHLLVAQYGELWDTRLWLKDRVEFAEQTRTAFFHDGRYGSAHMVAMEELETTFDLLTSAEFRALFGYSKKTRKYLCHSCIYNATTKNFYPRDGVCKTAFLENDGIHLCCLMCGDKSEVLRHKCKSGDCKGNVVAKEGEYEGLCHTCGEDHSGAAAQSHMS